MNSNAQAEMFDTDAELKARRFKLRVGCILQYLDDRRDSPTPLPVEFSTGQVIGETSVAAGGPA